MISYVYKITNKINNKVYIGKSNDPQKRWYKHLYTASSDRYHGFEYIHAAIKKYGSENFSFEIIENCSSEELSLKREIFWISYLNSNDKKFGYNLTFGGEGVSGRKQSDEEKIKRSQYMKEYWKTHVHPSIGTTISDKHKQKISSANKGKVLSDEEKIEISKRNSGSNNGMYGCPQTAEERKLKGLKISEFKKNNPIKPRIIKEETIEKLKIAVKKKSSQKLSDEQKDKIIELYNSGKFIKRELASIFDVEEKTIIYVVRYWEEVKVNKTKYLTNQQKDSIIKLYISNNYTKKQISELVDIPFNRVEAVIKMYRNKSA